MTQETFLETNIDDKLFHNRYKLTDIRREGGFAYVYRAYDNEKELYVALKCLKPERINDVKWSEYFRRERDILATIRSHPNIVEIYEKDIDPETGIEYFTMEWVDGQNLYDWRMRRPTHDVALYLDIAIQICSALQTIHNADLRHGDLSLGNILLTTRPEHITPKLIDFGLSWNADDGIPNFVGGTRKYLAPEQLSIGRWDHRADIYTLGAVLFFLFSGEHYLTRVHDAEVEDHDLTIDQLKAAICKDTPRQLQSVSQSAPKQLNELLVQLLEKSPEDRPSSVAKIQSYLKEIETEYQKRNQRSLHLLSATKSELIPQQDLPSEVKLGLYFPQAALQAAYDRLNDVLSQYKSIPEWVWQDSGQLTWQIFEQGKDYDFYIYNNGDGRNLGELSCRLVLAVDTGNEANAKLCEKLIDLRDDARREKTLVIECIRQPDRPRLLVRNISLKSIETGTRNIATIALKVQFDESVPYSGLPANLLAEIKKLPTNIEPDPEVRKRLEHWKAYLNVWEKLVLQKTYEVEYSGWRPDQGQTGEISRVWFYLRNDAEANWGKIRSSRNNPIHFRVVEEQAENSDNLEVEEEEAVYIEMGFIKRVSDRDNRYAILVELDEKILARYIDQSGALDIPRQGYLAYRAVGDLIQIKKQRRAFEDLEQGKAANPRLGQFIFDAGQAVYPEHERVVLRSDEFLLQTLNDNQRAAVEGALTAPDIYLIWGPPGTGKTTVIAELCYQFAHRGERVLIASQANLAVDNALSKLVHHPNIIALRIGNDGRIEKEGQPFTEKQVVSTWFERTAKDAEQRLLHIDEYFDRFAAFVEVDYVRLERYLKLIGEYQDVIPQLQAYHNQAAARLAGGRESYQIQIQRRDAVENVLSIIRDTEHYLKESRLPDSELWRQWRSIVIDLIASSDYQNYLANLALALTSIGKTQLTLTNEIINRILQRDDRAMLRGIQEGRQDTGLNRHRVTAILFLGEQLRDVVSQQENELRPLEIKLRTLREKLFGYHEIDSRIRLTEDFAQSRQLLQLVYDLHPAIRELLQTYRLYLAEYEQIKFQSSALHKLENKISAAGSKVEVLQRKIDLKSHIADQQMQLQEHLEALTEEAPHLQQARERITSLSQQFQGRSLIVRQIEMSELEQEQTVQECRAALTSLDSLLPRITAWLYSPQSAPSTHLPEVIMAALTHKREELTAPAVNPLTEVLENIRSVVSKAVTQYQSVIPSTYQQEAVDNDLAKMLRQELIALFVKQKINTTDVWLPQNPATVIQDLKQILEVYVSKAVKLKNSLRLGQKDWSTIASEFDSVRRFGGFINKQIEIQKSQKNIGRLSHNSGKLDHQRVIQVIQTVITEEEEKLRQRKLDVQRAIEREVQTVHSRIEPAQELLRQFVESALAHLSVMQPVCAEIDNLLAEAFFREPLELIVGADEKTDFALIAAQIDTANRNLTDFFMSGTKKMEDERKSFIQLQKQQKALELSIGEHEREVSDLAERIKPTFASVSAIQEQLSDWNSAEHISTLRDVVGDLLVDINSQASVNQDEFATAYTDTLNYHESLVRGLQARLKEVTGKSKLAAADIESSARQWQTNLLNCKNDIAEATQQALQQVQDLGIDGYALTSELSDESLRNWELLHQWVEQTIEQSMELANSLDSSQLLHSFQQMVRQAETEIHQQISDLIVANERAEKDVERTSIDQNRYQGRFNDEHDWWEEVFAAIPRHLRETLGNPIDIHTPTFIREVLNHVHGSDWQTEVKRQEALLKPAKAMLHDWTQRLQERIPRDVASLKELYVESANVVGVTCGQVNRIYSLMRNRRDLRPFDAVIIDEVSKATPPELLLPMLKGKKIILVGDHKQLPPMIEAQTVDDIAEEQGISSSDVSHLKRSLFESLYNFAPQVLKGMLTEQYRMRQPIMYAINQFYGDMLTGGHDRKHGLALPQIDPVTSIVWINTPRDENFFDKKEGFTYSNPSEIEIIERLLQQMNKAWLPHYIEGNPNSRKEVGLITFYMAQLAEFRDRFLHTDRYPALNLRIGTVDRFQGMERQVVIVSLVRNNSQGTIGFAKEPERINVAFSRAQELLVIVGCKSLFTQQAKKSGDATVIYSKVAYVVEHKGKTIDVSEFEQNR